ncbi:ABC transporter permease [Bosea sp. NBC_00550]|uniref:ABC transporter permease n=1 Tax=Bosea sp. NBC_00550 TaxID=2969621 RepID=UPI00222F1947|nr:ABC transporter permease [Bosea sp. NBC_00550]UZF95854.1 ABC transporter permease [Bosea sp. NBC_00550]
MDFLRSFARDRVGLFFAVVLLALFVVALTAPWITPRDPFAISLRQGMKPPSWANLLGTDQFGRDVLSRVILATQVTTKIALASILFAVVLGVPLGMFVGYRGGIWDAVTMRITDIMLIFPIILLAIVIVVVAGPSEQGVVIALGLSQMPQFIRVARGVTLSAKEELYVEAAIAAGASWPGILWRHIWPNISTPIIVQATLTLPVFVLNTAALSYLGLGVQPPTPEWGQMLNEAKEVLTSAPYLIIGPSVALFLFVLSANLVGDTLQETLNPKLKGRRLAMMGPRRFGAKTAGEPRPEPKVVP